ncbi:hypothetical protein D3C76_1546390 [compost metagenome]
MQIEQGLQQSQIIHIGVDPVESFRRRSKGCFNIVYRRKYACVDQPDFHLIHSFFPYLAQGYA